jgi:ribosomal protein S18 acetylase RimI-like enzyme
MADYEFPEVPEVESAYRAAHRALENIVSASEWRFNYMPESGLEFPEVVGQFPAMVQEAETVLAGQIGPRISWEAEQRDEWDLVPAGIDLNADRDLGFGVTLPDSAIEGEGGFWEGSPLEIAARAYRRAARWDFAPGEAGIWLLMLAPLSAVGSSESMPYFGHLTGFAVLYDRDEDDRHESVGHVWTAKAWRRRGIARRLLQEAAERFGADKIDGPYTQDGSALVAAFQHAR